MQTLYSNTLNCPCSKSAIPFYTFISITPTFHQVCSSDFVSDHTIDRLPHLDWLPFTDWRSQSFQRFRLLSTLCQLANDTIDDAIRRFKARSFVTSNLLTEITFDAQINATLAQFIQSTNIDYSRLVDIVRIIEQVNQHYTGVSRIGSFNVNAELITTTTVNETTGQKLAQVCYPFEKSRIRRVHSADYTRKIRVC